MESKTKTRFEWTFEGRGAGPGYTGFHDYLFRRSDGRHMEVDRGLCPETLLGRKTPFESELLDRMAEDAGLPS